VAEVPDNVFVLEECPHDWLFPQCSALVSFDLNLLVAYFEKRKKCFISSWREFSFDLQLSLLDMDLC